jgi:uncharacterized circularly permuted ATP-grasp superfamily protein
MFGRVGITFAVYGESGGTERTIPFDLVPRIFRLRVEPFRARFKQRNGAKYVLHDVYHAQHILKAGVIPREQVINNAVQTEWWVMCR